MAIAQISNDEMDGCCVVRLLSNFGGSKNRSWEGELGDIKEIKRQIKEIALEEINDGDYEMRDMACAVAFLTTDQENAIKALVEIGFTKSSNFKKPKHPESDLVVLTMGGAALQDWAEAYVEPKKRETVNLNSNPNSKKKKATAVPITIAAPAASVSWDEDFEEEDI